MAKGGVKLMRVHKCVGDSRSALAMRTASITLSCIAIFAATLFVPSKSQALPQIQTHFGVGGNCASCHSSPTGGTTLNAQGNAAKSIGLNGIPALVNKAVPGTHSPEPVNLGIVHVGETAQRALSIANNAVGQTVGIDFPAESLNASMGSPSTGITASGSATIAPGTTNSSSLLVGINTSSAGNRSGTAQILLSSAGTPATSIAAAIAPTGLPSQTVSVSGIVNNFANPVLQLAPGSPGTLTQAGSVYNVNFGSLVNGSSQIMTLRLLNSVVGPADLLDGSFQLPGTPRLAYTNFGNFSNIAAGGLVDNLRASITATGAAGDFSESLVLRTTGHNSSGFSGALPNITINFLGSILGPDNPGPGPDNPGPGPDNPGPAVPEPSTIILLATGLLGLAAYRRRL